MHLRLVGDDNVLALCLGADVVCDPCSRAGVQGTVDLVEEVQWRRVGGLQGKGERQRGKRLLPPTKRWEGPPAAVVRPATTRMVSEATDYLPANLIHPILCDHAKHREFLMQTHERHIICVSVAGFAVDGASMYGCVRYASCLTWKSRPCAKASLTSSACEQ